MKSSPDVDLRLTRSGGSVSPGMEELDDRKKVAVGEKLDQIKIGWERVRAPGKTGPPTKKARCALT